ncbi:hypothetical protein ACEE23_06190 [Corynebacterium sp. 32222D000AT]|uniref:hypothetical protein n=1 Tax=unclassified Corynebacterium TaxID=2624378 RepID=UPI002A9C5C5D|nr:hypothetical protein [Mycobacteriaceae bacterium]MDY5828509.1 hypothetical protein [Corynebacterium sp.]
MRNFRTAAVAAATALTVAFSGTAIASAEDNVSEETKSSSIGSLSSKWGKDLGAWDLDENGNAVVKDEHQATGVDTLGQEKVENDQLPKWDVLFRDATIAGGVLSLVGGLIAAYNYAVFNGILPGHIFDGLFK